MCHPGKVVTIATALFFNTPAFTADQVSPTELNRAQQLVFIKDHLQGVPSGSTLNYDFASEAKDVESYSDTVKITVTGVVEEGKRNLEFDFLSGPRHIDFAPAVGYTGNPVIIHFLERDISQMSKEMGGSNGYFRNRIRESFGRPTEVHDVKLTFQGKELDGTEVVVKPFTADLNIANFGPYANKRYEFTFSDQVPGGIYRIHTLVPGESGAGVLIDEALTFHQITPAI
ncbi:MAG: hypothetical protein GY696_04335 [Gammaproteobacteria bacterium]|nr:hypothetical protein [Gammaproteobacteria bacterium]